MTANHIRNITLRPGKSTVPYTAFWGREPSYTTLRMFGCKAYVLVPKDKRSSKMNPVCEIGMMVGYPTEAKGYRILFQNGSDHWTVQAKRDVVFDETQIGLALCFPQRKRGRSPSPERPLDAHVVFDSDADDCPPDSTGGESPLRVRRVGRPPVRGRSGGGIIRIQGEEHLCGCRDCVTPMRQ